MEMLVSPQGQKHNIQVQAWKFSPGGSNKDLWLIVREGSLADVDVALALLKKQGGNINSRNKFGLTPLHIATWRNHIPIIRRLLIAGADPDAKDGESGWTSLHRALHFGHLAVASILLQSGACITVEDSKSCTPVDLLSGPVLQAIGDGHDSVATEVFSWGSGANYQLGTGNAHLQRLPCKVDALHGSFIKLVSAAKFHSVAVSARGEVYSWGFGRGGRLGHPDFDIHSGQAAVITPRQVTSGLGSRRVKAIAAAKHHTVLAAESGEVFTWGSNREGQLGYIVDTQPTPRRVSLLRSRIISVAAANKHTAVVSDSGEVFTWGYNREGQLGYGTSNSASNYNPRVVEYLKGKVFTGVAAAKYHTIVVGADGEVYTWGHRLVTPRRVVIARNLKKSGSCPLKFHRMERLHVASIAAGMVHSLALTDDGAVFYWLSADPDLRCQQLYSLCAKKVVSISVGKYWSAVATVTGDVYMWDGKKGEDNLPAVTRLHGVKRATSVSVGETHLLIVGSLYHPTYPPNVIDSLENQKLQVGDEVEDLDEDFMYNDVESNHMSSAVEKDDCAQRPLPSLKSLCEKVAAESLVEPRNAIQMLEIADSLEAEDLRKHCQDIVVHNLDYILTVSSHAFASASPEILANLENLLDLRSSEPWSYRRLPTPTATFPLVINSEEEDSEYDVPRTRDNHNNKSTLKIGNERSEFFLQPKDDPNRGISKKVRALRKKLQQIEMLEMKQSTGHLLDDQQLAKLQTRLALESSLAELGLPVEKVQAKASVAVLSDVKGNKKAEVSRKQRRKSKQKAAQWETVPVVGRADVESNLVKDSLDVGISQVSMNKEEENIFEGGVGSQSSKELPFFVQKKDSSDSPKSKGSSPSISKKKNRKGGLSMFLSGALDDTPKDVAPPPQTPRSEGPAWGGAKVSKGFASLREIQDEQSKTKGNQSTKNKDQVEDHSDVKSDGKILLSSFLPSKPIPVISSRTSQAPDAERSTPPWASGTPLLSRTSLRDIQMQHGKQQQNSSHSPKARTAGFSIVSSQGSPSDSPGLNRWFKPEICTPSSIRSIQIEEKAMKDLKRFYTSVKVVKNPT
ncbi:hypothetical protein P3X46_008200 [Hevea brasiliensis]|uniref:RCC1-like domain-containing protein n=1 Tax=Hevea brasiliensis TaxID=3981 RepID=A0ABQ9ML92_HEVBR|nr:uncharacterized protein LOC110668927 isoform X2 [Hevea brasiliensis]KAJ9179886.1 hypothetical protein P3X46_008200 [Hevea brasiliensis]